MDDYICCSTYWQTIHERAVVGFVAILGDNQQALSPLYSELSSLLQHL